MNLPKKGLLSLSLMIAGTLVATIEESTTQVIIKNDSGYKLTLKKVLFYHPDGSESTESLVIDKGKTATFNPWHKGTTLTFEYLQIVTSPERTILTRRQLENNPNKSALIITITSGWLEWKETQQWQVPVSEGDFVKL